MKFVEEKLGNIINLTMGQSPKSEYYNFKNDGLPFLQGNKDFGFKYPSLEMYTSKITKIANKDDILMSVRAPVGDINIAPEKLCIGRGLCSLKMKKSDNIFLYYLLKYYSKAFINNESGTVFGSINKNDINNLNILIPQNVGDQEKIGEILNQIDSKIEVNMKINNNLEQLIKSLFTHWINGFKICDYIIEYKSSEFGNMPEKWNVKRLGDILISLESGKRPTGNITEIDEGILSIGAENILGLGKFDYSKNKLIKEEFFNSMKKGIVKNKYVLLYKDGAQLGRKSLFMENFPFENVVLSNMYLY